MNFKILTVVSISVALSSCFFMALFLLSLTDRSSTSSSTDEQVVVPQIIRSPARIPPELVPFVPRFVSLLRAKGFMVGETDNDEALNLVFEFDGVPFNLRVSVSLWREGIPILTASSTDSGLFTAFSRGGAVNLLSDSTISKFENELQKLSVRTIIISDGEGYKPLL